MSTVRRTVVSEPADAGNPVRFDRATERRWALDAADVVSLIAGLLFGVLGLLVLIDLGFTDFPSEATAEVMGMSMTQLWGGISLVIGLLLLGGAGAYGRSLTIFAGGLLVVAGIVVVAAQDELDPVLAAEKSFGWLSLLVGAIVLLAAIAVPTVASRSERVVDDGVVR